MMNSHKVGAFEAKTHFSSLLERAENGEFITITRHGKAVARLTPIEDNEVNKKYLAAENLKKIRASIAVKNENKFSEWMEFRKEGRK